MTARKKKPTSSPARPWLDRAKAATDAAAFAGLLAEVRIRPVTEREMRALRPLFTTPAPDGAVQIDNDRLVEVLLAACLTDADGARLLPDGRAGEAADLPSYLFQTLGRRVLSANGYGGDAGNA